MTIDQSILDNLTDEERAALEEPDSEHEHEEVDLEQVAAQQKKEGQEDHQDDDQDDKPEQVQPVEVDKKDEQQQAEPEQPSPQPVFKPVATEELTEKYSVLDTRENDLVEKFEEGELTTREYNAQLREINKERGELDWLQRKDEMNRESVEQQVDRQWAADVNAFLPGHPAISENDQNWKSFDAVLRQVTGSRQAQGKSYGTPELERAYRIWADEQGIAQTEPPKADPKQEDKPQQKEKVKPLDIPPTLAKVPSAAPEDTDDGKFAALDRMAESDPQKYQETIARMSPDEYSVYSSR